MIFFVLFYDFLNNVYFFSIYFQKSLCIGLVSDKIKLGQGNLFLDQNNFIWSDM